MPFLKEYLYRTKVSHGSDELMYIIVICSSGFFDIESMRKKMKKCRHTN